MLFLLICCSPGCHAAPSAHLRNPSLPLRASISALPSLLLPLPHERMEPGVGSETRTEQDQQASEIVETMARLPCGDATVEAC